MNTARRLFLVQSLALATSPVFASMPHIVLLGDSIFDNGSYTNGKPDVISQVRDVLPAGWKATLGAVDGATTRSIDAQLARLPSDTTHLVLSVGGNDALGSQHVLQARTSTTGEGLIQLARVVAEFESRYRAVVSACLRRRLPLLLCTIYNGNFPERSFQQQATTAIAVFNDAILRVALEHGLSVLELRQICSAPEDYANPIEPSSVGGAKIARAIAVALTDPAAARRRSLVMGTP